MRNDRAGRPTSLPLSRATTNEPDDALFDTMAAKLYAAVISDVLDGLGRREQVLRPGIVPAQPDPGQVLVGRAATVLVGPQSGIDPEPYTNQIAAIDALKPGDVVVSAVGGLTEVAVWGELFSTAAMARGARGFLTDGRHRDTRMLLDLGFPVFSRGSQPVDMAGRAEVIERGGAVEIAGVLVRQGDIVFAEIDGIVIIPSELADETVKRAFAKTEKEDNARDELRAGRLLSEVWAKHRVL